MNVVFIHDHKFRHNTTGFYSPGGLSKEVLLRYKEWFGHVNVVGRVVEQCTIPSTYSKIDDPDIDISTVEELNKLVYNADCVIARLPSIYGYIAVLLARLFHKPYMVEVVGCTLDALINHGFQGKLLAIPSFLFMRTIVKNAPYALYVTESFLQKRYPCNGITESVSDVAIEACSDEVLRKRIERIHTNRDQLRIGTAGAIDVAYKGQEYVIRAIPLIEKRTRREVTYSLIGAGDKSRLARIADELGVRDRVEFVGVLNHEGVFAWLDGIDIYIQPSMLEGLSRALVEAESRALPCLATSCGGNVELLEKEVLYSTKRKTKMPQLIANYVLSFEEDFAEKNARRNFIYSNSHFNPTEISERRRRFYVQFRNEVEDRSGAQE